MADMSGFSSGGDSYSYDPSMFGADPFSGTAALSTQDYGPSTVDPASTGGYGSNFSVDDINALLSGGNGGGLSALLQSNVGAAPVAAVALPTAQQSPLQAAFNPAKDSQAAYAADPSLSPISETGNGVSSLSPTASSTSATSEKPGVFSQLLKGLGISGDISDPKTLSAWMKLLTGGGAILNTLLNKNVSANSMTPQQALATLPAVAQFTPTQQGWANAFFNTPNTPWTQRATQSAAAMPSSIVAGTRGYAAGGDVEGAGPLEEPRGALGLVHGAGGGQDDAVHARVSPGEYVMDADVVSALGDGNNARGAELLDAWREAIREHKRSAPPDKIPPRAHAPTQYLPKGGRA